MKITELEYDTEKISLEKPWLTEEKIIEFLDKYLKTIEKDQYLYKLKSAIEKKDYEVIVQTSHAILGGARSLSILKIVTLCKKIEDNAREEKSIDYKEWFSRLLQYFSKLKHYVPHKG